MDMLVREVRREIELVCLRKNVLEPFGMPISGHFDNSISIFIHFHPFLVYLIHFHLSISISISSILYIWNGQNYFNHSKYNGQND